MAEIVAAYSPWELGVYRIENTLVRPWVRGYKKHVNWEHPWQYHDLDVEAQRSAEIAGAARAALHRSATRRGRIRRARRCLARVPAA